MPRANPTQDITATIGEYTCKTTGAKKKRYIKVGTAFTDDQGRVSLKIDALPVGPFWSGYLSLYPIERDHERRQQPPQARQSTPPPVNDIIGNDDGADDDIPF